VVLLCRLLGVHRSGFYAWRHHPESKRSIEDRRLLGLIRASFEASQGIYGSKRIFCDLREVGETCGVHRVARIMRAHKIAALRGYKSHRFHYHKPAKAAPNRLSQQFSMQMPDEAWVTDITYIRTFQGWLYLAVVLDLFSRKVIGWSMKSTLGKEIVLDAILMAVWRRKPTKPVIIHSDQGSQYSSDEWKRFCAQHQLEASMSRRGNCYDNAVAESFFSSLKKERIRNHVYHTRDKARADIFDYIEVFYNRARRHSHLNGMSPEAFEEVWRKQG
jgi:putative transposase